MNALTRSALGAALALGLAAGASAADLKVGLSVSLSGPNASLGVPYAKGMQAAVAYKPEINGHKVQLIVLDDGSDPTTAGRNARKLIEEDKVDVIMGTSGVPAAIAMAQVAGETRTPMIGLTPISLKGAALDWTVTVAQPTQLMVDAVVDRMKKAKVKTVAYIGFSDGWGDLVYDALMKATAPAGIKVVTNERYARADASVTGQVLKIIGMHPDAVMTGGAGTPGALPYLALAQRGYKGPVYGQHGLINADFVRVGGAAVEGTQVPTGPIIVAEQLPDNYPTKKIGLEFRKIFQ
jgi:branched-chain amino acid transport system substrate-binding protein